LIQLFRFRRPGGFAPLAGLLGPMALRPRAHIGVPPTSLALRGGSLLYDLCGLLGMYFCSAFAPVSEQIKWGLEPTAPAGPGQSPSLDFPFTRPPA
jgi:hypothetical protein